MQNVDYILWVDDSQSDIKLIDILLKKAKYTGKIKPIYYGSDVIPYLQRNRDTPPQLIVLDLGLPDINGIEVLKTLKSSKQFFHIPLIIRTGHAHPRLPNECKKLGADGFILKGFDLNDLKSQIRTILKTMRN